MNNGIRLYLANTILYHGNADFWNVRYDYHTYYGYKLGKLSKYWKYFMITEHNCPFIPTLHAWFLKISVTGHEKPCAHVKMPG